MDYLDYDYEAEDFRDVKEELPRKWCTKEDRLIKSTKAREKRARRKAIQDKRWERALHM